MRRLRSRGGVTLIELLLAAMTLAIAISALLGAFLGQMTLKEHANNLSLAIHDANRVIEQIRQDNITCVGNTPEIDPGDLAGAPTSWNAWLEGAAEGKSIPNANANAQERIVVTCRSRAGGTAYCGTGGAVPQVGTGEWVTVAGSTTYNPIQVTVSVCWRHRQRVIGECAWDGAALNPVDSVSAPYVFPGVIESPASLTTLVTCRG